MGRAKKSVEVETQVIARGNVVPMMTETESEETVQYVSDEDAAREDRLVSEIRMITEQTKQVVLFNSIEIGRRLTEAKAMVKRGTWGTWLRGSCVRCIGYRRPGYAVGEGRPLPTVSSTRYRLSPCPPERAW